jgi:hypothetical protein
MYIRSLLPCVVSLTSLATLLAGCDSARSPAPTEPAPGLRADLTARGRPTDVQRLPINDSFTVPPGVTCDEFAVHWDVVGNVVLQSWATEEGLLFKEEDNVWVTFTNTETGASVTNHQSDAIEFLIRDDVVEVQGNGGSMRITYPGEGLIGLSAGHVVSIVDYSADPPQLISAVFRGPTDEADICALIG